MTAHDLPMRVFRAEVVAVSDLSPSMRRVVLGGEGLADFRSTGVPDEYVRLVFPADGATEPVLPTVTAGTVDYGSIDLATMRTYTVRAFDPATHEVTVDLVVHDRGVATTWARAARPGDVVGINTPCGIYDPPADLRWQLLVADAAALPALARIVEQTPPHVPTRAVVEVADAHQRITLPEHPALRVTWLHGGNGHGRSSLAQAVRTLPSDAAEGGYVWVAGESSALRAVRRHLRRELGLPATAYKAVGYWIERYEEWQARYDALDEQVRRDLADLWAQDLEEEVIEDEYDDRLTALGL